MGQYVVKDIILAAAVLVVAADVRRRNRKTPPPIEHVEPERVPAGRF
jgi:hypothetical protein